MSQSRAEKDIAGLDDVELIRVLTRDAKEQSPEVIAAATSEATRRGLPIDEAFIPPDEESAAQPDEAKAGSRRFEATGTPVACPHCRGNRFHAREILLNTRGLTFLKLDWMNRSATALVCAACGQVQLFAVKPTEMDGE